MFLPLFGCSSAESSTPVADGSADAADVAMPAVESCASADEGTECSSPQTFVRACPCLNGIGVILVCCTVHRVVRAQSCVDVVFSPSCEPRDTGAPVDSASSDDGDAPREVDGALD